MILPDKHVRLSNSLLNVGAVLLTMMRPSQTVTELWDRARPRREIRTFDRFVMGMDLLFLLGTVEIEGSRIVKVKDRARRPAGEQAPAQAAGRSRGRYGGSARRLAEAGVWRNAVKGRR